MREVMRRVGTNLGLRQWCIQDSAQLEVEVVSDSILCGVDFGDNMEGNVSLKEIANIRIRFPGEIRFPSYDPGMLTVATWVTNFMFPKHSVPGPRVFNSNVGADPGKYYL